jgi:3-hydroxybutyryl-CoA dehydratase
VPSPARASAPSRSGSAHTYFEDVEIGVPHETPGMTITETHVGLFAGLVGERSADAFAVPDLLPLCLSSGLGWRTATPPLVVLAFMGFEWRSHLPVRVGDTIHSRSHTSAKRAMKEGGVLFEERKIMNQRGEVVQSCRITLLVARRPAS